MGKITKAAECKVTFGGRKIDFGALRNEPSLMLNRSIFMSLGVLQFGGTVDQFDSVPFQNLHKGSAELLGIIAKLEIGIKLMWHTCHVKING